MSEMSHIKTLYKDFASKHNAIEVYLEKLKQDAGEIGQLSYELISYLQKKHEIIEDFRNTKRKTVPSSQFLTDERPEDNPNEKIGDLKEIDERIKDKVKHLQVLQSNHRIPHFKSLGMAFDQLEKIIDTIHDSYEESFKGT